MGLKRLFFWLITFSIPVAFLAGSLYFLWSHKGSLASRWLETASIELLVATLSEDERKDLYDRIAKETKGPWDIDPDPAVGRVLKRNARFMMHGVPLFTNNANQAGKRRHLPANPGVFRIVMLGDSVVMGYGVEERLRVGDRMEAILRDLGVRPEGKRVEVYTIGMSSWTGITEAAYLTSRFSDYAPDLVIQLLVANDIKWNDGVSGSGHSTNRISPQRRALGSGFLGGWRYGSVNGQRVESLLTAGASNAGREVWLETFDRIKRLQEVAEASGAKFLLAALNQSPILRDLVIWHRQAVGVTAPLLLSNYFQGPEYELPDDPHPSAKGHDLLALHFLHALAELKWLPLDPKDLPSLPPALDLTLEHSITWDAVERTQEFYMEHLPSDLDLAEVSQEEAASFLGGFFPESYKDESKGPPYGSLQAGVVLKRKPESRNLLAVVEVPAKPELYPFELTLLVNGEKKAILTLPDVSQAGRHELTAPNQGDPMNGSYVEVVFKANRHFATITDSTMKSFRLLAVRQE